MSNLLQRIAGGPITWGVDGSPGWGHLMHRDRVMTEMAAVGLQATELGPDGFLPTDPDELVEYVAGYGLEVVAGFIPAVLYRTEGVDDQLDYVARAARQLARAGSQVAVIGADSHYDGYDTEVEMSEDEWQVFLTNLARLMNLVSEEGLATAVHPHWGMAISRKRHVERLLESCEVGICLDTGHLQLAGCDPVDIARLASTRIDHVHLKDVDSEMAARVRHGDLPFRQAVIDGMFTPLGSGGIDFSGLIRYLESAGFQGWYVLEQDCALSTEPQPGAGPFADALTSVKYLEELAADL